MSAWVAFTDASQAQPGRRMRLPKSNLLFTVQKRGRVAGAQHIFLDHIGSVSIERAKRQRWEIEL